MGKGKKGSEIELKIMEIRGKVKNEQDIYYSFMT